MPRIIENEREHDKQIGIRLLNLRLTTGKSRQDFVVPIGVTHQQYHKYETGTNRISVSKLAKIADYYNYPLSFLVYGNDEFDNIFNETSRMCLECMSVFNKLTPKQQNCIVRLLKTMVDKD